MELLFVLNDNNSQGNKSHYVYIKDLNGFMYDKKDKNKKYFCVNWLQCFSSKTILTNHKKVYLEISGKQSANILKKYINVWFINYEKQLRVPFVFYAHLESNLRQIQKPNRDNVDASYTDKYQENIAFSYDYKILCSDHRFSKSVQIYRGGNAV